MKMRTPKVPLIRQLRSTPATPGADAMAKSRARVTQWFNEHAPLVEWGEMTTPLGLLFLAVNRNGLFALDFGRSESEFLKRLDPRAQLKKNSPGVAAVVDQLRKYFAGALCDFNLPLDLSRLTGFQRNVLECTQRIPRGQIWTYNQLARELGRPHSSRPVGQALARNPIPIIIPCHRVIASNGSLRGYSGGSGLKTKQWLLEFEGAL